MDGLLQPGRLLRVMDFSRHARGVLRFVWSHPANRGRRMSSIGRAVLFQVQGRMGKRTLTPIGELGRMWAELHYTASSSVVYANPPDWKEMLAWKRILRQRDLFIDVGSNVGSYALWAGGLGAEVIAVEPGREAVTRLRENVSLNDFSVEVVACALGATPGVMRLTTGLDTVNHLLIDSAAPGDEVEVRTLDELLGGRVARGVKVDVEGAERLVLEGSKRALTSRRIEFMQLEWNEMSRRTLSEDREPVETILRSHGYLLCRPDQHGHLKLVGDFGFGADIFAVAPQHALLVMR